MCCENIFEFENLKKEGVPKIRWVEINGHLIKVKFLFITLVK